jgi:hypothetical protein
LVDSANDKHPELCTKFGLVCNLLVPALDLLTPFPGGHDDTNNHDIVDLQGTAYLLWQLSPGV